MGFYDPLAERLSAVAGSSIALADFVPFVETPRRPVHTGDRVIAADTAGILAVNAGYFTTLGIEIARGRNFTAADRIESDPVALVSATLARRLWPNANPIGQRLSIGEPSNRDAPSPTWRTVVGVVRDVRQTYGDTDLRDVYLSFPQVPGRFASLYLRTEQPALSWLASVRGTIADIDPYVTINVSGALSDEDRQLAGTTFLSAILTGSAAFAVFLALLGMYGVTAYSTQQREREVAIRIALGATVDTIVRMFLKQGLIVLAAGLACGLLGAIVVARTLEHEIHGVRPFDLWTLAATCALMISTALPAIWIPARRAAIRSRTGLLNEN
jgi:hypothetical protein